MSPLNPRLLFLKLDLKPSFFLKTLTHIFLKTGTLLDLCGPAEKPMASKPRIIDIE